MELVRQTKALGRLPVVNFAAGGVATPADAALMMQVGAAEGWGWGLGLLGAGHKEGFEHQSRPVAAAAGAHDAGGCCWGLWLGIGPGAAVVGQRNFCGRPLWAL